MIEAIGHRFLNRYFQACSNLLKPDGLMLLQAITIPEYRYKRALKEVDFIKRYIFPGSFLPSNAAMLQAVAAKTDLNMVHLEDLTPHYARTLAAWRDNFLARSKQPRPGRNGPGSEAYVALLFQLPVKAASTSVSLPVPRLWFAKPRNQHKPLLHRFAALDTPLSA